MFRIAFLTLFALGCNADGYGGLGGGFGGGLGGYGGLNGGIQSHRTVELKQPMTLGGGYGEQPQVIEVNPDHVPVQVHFKTASSRVNVHQSHHPGSAPQVEHASFQDEPHRVVHEVVKPVIQEVREIIQPYRRVTQEIRPVIEEVHTVVHKGEGRGGQGGYAGGRGGQGGYSGGSHQLGKGVGGGLGYKAGGKAKARA